MKLTPEQVEAFHYCAMRDLEESGAMPAEVRRSGFAIHHCLMPHRSLENRTGQPRRGLAMHFMDAKVLDPDMLKILHEGATPLRRGQASGHGAL